MRVKSHAFGYVEVTQKPSTLQKMNLDGIAYELKPDCEITRYVVYLIYKDGGMKAVDAYISTFKPSSSRIKRLQETLKESGVMLWNRIKVAYTGFKLIVIKKARI